MAQTLDEFLQEARDELVSFERYWRDQHEKSPDAYPMKMRDGDEGLWWEFLRTSDGA